LNLSILAGISSSEGCVTRADNRDLNDSNNAQSLDEASIRARKLRGESGVEIIEALAAGSATWNSKTEFSKAKWLKRKAKKYIPWVQVLEPTAVAVTEAYFVRAAGHGQACRPDAIAQLLARSNIGVGSRVIVVDSFRGLVLGAVAERAGSTGNVLLLHEGPKASIDAIKKFNFSPDLRKSMSIAPTDVCFTEALKEEITAKTLISQDEGSPQNHSTIVKATAIQTGGTQVLQQPSMGPHITCRAWFNQKSHALVLAPGHEPISILKATLPALFDSCPLVIYSEHVEPLTRAFAWLKISGNAINLQLTETWLREFQILENRSHPAMTMCANAGFVLSAIKIARERELARCVHKRIRHE
jgi:tRNA (adenine-N(1)-)-methyltransferase non-catalytic subunit